MNRKYLLGCTSLVAIAFGSQAALADVSAQEVWDNWQSQMAIYGEDNLTIGAETMSGDTLTVESVTMELSENDVSVIAQMGPITFTENGDGTVTIGLPESYGASLDIEGTPIDLTVALENMQLVASGVPEMISYDLTGDSYSISIDSLGPEFEEEGVLNAAQVVSSDITGAYVVRSGNLTNIDYAITVGSVEFDVDLREVDGPGKIFVDADISDLIAAMKIALPPEMDMASQESMFVDGFALEAGYSVGASTYVFDIDIDGEAAKGSVSLEQAALEVAMDYDGLYYASEGSGIAAALSFPNELPFPVEIELGAYDYGFDIPMSQEGAPREFALGLALVDLSVSDSIWNLIDPGTVLPRDPATIAMDLSGEVTPFFDFLDPEQADAAAMADVPGEIHGVTLNDLTLSIAGAEVLGTGDFTFDNSDFQTIPGMPRPQGEANFELNGVNGLIDKLVQIGIIPEGEAMMPRMMLGMFATPVGDDALTSRIEINDQGHIFANGQRLQ